MACSAIAYRMPTRDVFKILSRAEEKWAKRTRKPYHHVIELELAWSMHGLAKLKQYNDFSRINRSISIWYKWAMLKAIRSFSMALIFHMDVCSSSKKRFTILTNHVSFWWVICHKFQGSTNFQFFSLSNLFPSLVHFIS